MTHVPLCPAVSADFDSDEGWLLVYVHNDESKQTALHIYDAHTMNPVPIARISTPQRVPFGFHGMFVSRDQVAEQKTTTL
jgi:carotenoid 9,10(9',10')-cleavage dioxygenase 1